MITFSGCPGESEHSLRPSWVTCSWPDDFPETLAWQWEERVLPYWAEAAAFARDHGVHVAIEPHPGFVVYNTASMLRLRESGGGRHRRQLRSLAPVLAGDGPARLRARARGTRSSTCMPRTRASRANCWRSTASSSRFPAIAPPSEAGSSARSAPGHPSPFWRELVETLRIGRDTTVRSRSSTRIRCSRARRVSRSPSRRFARRSIGGGGVSAEVVVGLDVGTTGVKGVAVEPDGGSPPSPSRAIRSRRLEPAGRSRIPRTGGARRERCSGGSGREIGATREIAGIGLSGQMHGLVALDTADRVIRPAILWNDQRTGAECAEIEERIGLERLIALTGNRALTGFTAPKLLWLRRHEPDAYARIARIMLPKDYVRLRLTGEWATDVADASGTLLLDVARRTWSHEVLDALELPAAWLPPVLESPETSGLTLACDEVSQGIPVAAGAGDCAAAAVGVGIDRPGPLSIVMGTSGVVFAALPAFASDPEARVHAFCHAVPGQWHAMGVMLSAAGSLQWLRDRLAPETAFADLVAEAEAWGPGDEGLLFAPYLAGERTPHADPSARAAFTGPRAPARPRRPRPGGARGRRVRPARLARARRVARRPGRPRASLGRRRPRALAPDRGVRARHPDRAHRRRGRLGSRCRAARRCGGAGCSPTFPTPSPAAFASALPLSPTPPGSPPTRRPIRASARCIPHSTP